MIQILSIPIDNLTRLEVEDWIVTALINSSSRASDSKTTFYHIATVNPEFLVAAKKNLKFKKLLQKTALNVCDGFGIKFWARVLYKKSIQRITGVELAETICRIAESQKKSVYFLGGFGVADKAAAVMKSKYPDLMISGTEDGNPNNISDQLKQAQPAIIFVAFGAPKQEFWLQRFGAESGATIGIGIGGTFDFWTGKAIRAPKIFRSIGLEWLWRLITQPQRWKRIWNATVVFSWMVVRAKIKNYKI